MGATPVGDDPLEIRVHGMDCAEEVTPLRRELAPLVDDEDRLRFDVLNGKLTVMGGEPRVTMPQLLAAIERTGLRAEVWARTPDRRSASPFWRRRARAVLTAISGLAAVAGFLIHASSAGSAADALGSEGTGQGAEVPAAARVSYAFAILMGLGAVLPKAVIAVRRLRPDINFLMVIAVSGAVIIGEWFEGATVAFLFSLSLALEAWSIGRARRAVESLLELTPQTAHVVRGEGMTEEVRAEAVPVSARIRVKPGERFPLDGVVTAGSGAVNQAPITGESAPVEKNVADPVFAGTINGDASFEVRTTRVASDTTLARITRLVGEAQSRRSASERWVDRFARLYTPAILGLAVVALFVPPVLFARDWTSSLYDALVLLVIACPCALVISTPVSIVAGLAAAARHGILVKGGEHLECAARLDAIAFDKTGTLTEGKPVVVEVVPLDGHSKAELLTRAASLEVSSDHPLARAILARAAEDGVAVVAVEGMRMIQGKGAMGRVDGRELWLGSHRYLEERGEETPELHARLESLAVGGRSVVVVGDGTHVCGLIAVADRVRENAAESLRSLRAAGVERLVMLSGDNAATARAIGDLAAIDEVRAELLPEEKVSVIEELLTRFDAVGMVGDGVNDAPALARASLGIAMGRGGSDVAIESADVVLMTDDLAKLPWLVAHARRTLRVVRQNIAFSIGVKAMFAVLTVVGTARMWVAIAADMGASLLVVANGLRLLAARGTPSERREPRSTT